MRFCTLLLVLVLSSPAHAWNAAGHRLVAVIAWQRMDSPTRNFVQRTLSQHPDYPEWLAQAGNHSPALIFAESSTWADEIRGDPRFYDEQRESPTPAIPGLPDNARHKKWHYVDLDRQGKVVEGELDQRIEALIRLLEISRKRGELAWALPWITHLVGDIHQPLHVGHAEDEGGTQVEIEDATSPRRPFLKLHRYWDDLPGSSRLRGQRLENMARALVDRYRPAPLRSVADWRDESHALLDRAYPRTTGSLLPLVTPEFDTHALTLAQQRLVDAGARLAGVLEQIARRRVPRETDLER